MEVHIHCFVWKYILLLSVLHFNNGLTNDLDAVVVNDSWVPDLVRTLTEFNKKITSVDKITNELNSHIINDTVTKPAIDKDNVIFKSMYQMVSARVEEINVVLNKTKDAMEAEIHNLDSNSGFHPSYPHPDCCWSSYFKNTTGNHYEARLRHYASMNAPCVSRQDGGYSLLRWKIRNSTEIFKENYEQHPSILHQYYASLDGHFVQYPTNSRMCSRTISDPLSSNHEYNVSSPLLGEGLIDKLFMEQKNMVIILDVGSTGLGTMMSNYKLQILIDATKQVLGTLTPNDKINLVAFNESVYTPESCDNRLYIADERNVYLLGKYMRQLQPGGQSNYTKALNKAYELLVQERSANKNRTSSVDTIIFITDGEQPALNASEFYKGIDESLKKLGRNVRHFIYRFKKRSQVNDSSPNDDVLRNFAYGNITISSMVDRSPIKKIRNQMSGHFQTLTLDEYREVHYYYKHLQYKIRKNAVIIGPRVDSYVGLILTWIKPVFRQSNGSVHGAAAIDVDVATLFKEIQNFEFGVKNYAFLIEKVHGHVILHPKLLDPSRTDFGEPVFPNLEDLESAFGEDQQRKLLAADENIRFFPAKAHAGRSIFRSGEEEKPMQDATVFYALIPKTDFVVVMVQFADDEEILNPGPVSKTDSYFAPYHRLDLMNELNLSHKTGSHPLENEVCSMLNQYSSPNRSTIKLAPSIFVNSEEYKYRPENTTTVFEMNKFFSDLEDTHFIRPDMKLQVLYFLRATNSTDSYWKHYQKAAVERFIGTVSGVLRIFPGKPFVNEFDPRNYYWFKRSVSQPGDLIFTSGKIGKSSHQDLVIITQALVQSVGSSVTHKEVRQTLGVIGATITHRTLTALFFNTIPACVQGNLTCHILNDVGYLMSYGDSDDGMYKTHLIDKYPWLMKKLLQNRAIRPKWCTRMSLGEHRFSYRLQTAKDSYVNRTGTCHDYVIVSITGTNLYLLALHNRSASGCDDNQHDQARFKKALNGTCARNETTCRNCDLGENVTYQCPCTCSSDFDACNDRFVDSRSPTFPHTACYEEPYSQPHLGPNIDPLEIHDFAKQGISQCPVPCVLMETDEECREQRHCLWNETDDYPTCQWKPESEITTYTYTLKKPSTTVSSTLSSKPSISEVGSSKSTPKSSSESTTQKQMNNSGVVISSTYSSKLNNTSNAKATKDSDLMSSSTSSQNGIRTFSYTTLPFTVMPSSPLASSTPPSTSLPSTTMPSTSLPSTTMQPTSLPSTTMPSTSLASTTLSSTTSSSTTSSSTTSPSTSLASTILPSTTASVPSTSPERHETSNHIPSTKGKSTIKAETLIPAQTITKRTQLHQQTTRKTYRKTESITSTVIQHDDNGGLIAGVVIAVLVLLLLVAFIVYKVFGRRIGRPFILGGPEGRYAGRPSMALFRRDKDTVVLSGESSISNTPYQALEPDG